MTAVQYLGLKSQGRITQYSCVGHEKEELIEKFSDTLGFVLKSQYLIVVHFVKFLLNIFIFQVQSSLLIPELLIPGFTNSRVFFGAHPS